jgi:hypothetical protein
MVSNISLCEHINEYLFSIKEKGNYFLAQRLSGFPDGDVKNFYFLWKEFRHVTHFHPTMCSIQFNSIQFNSIQYNLQTLTMLLGGHGRVKVSDLFRL